MRGNEKQQGGMFSYVSMEERVPGDHPLRPIRKLVDQILATMSKRFDDLYAGNGRPSIPPEHLLRALLLQIFYSIRSERMLMEHLDYNLLFRWFVGLEMDEAVWNHALIARSLSQTKNGLEFKGTKTDDPRVAKIPEETLPKLEAHRKCQDEFRRQFGPDYRNDLDLIFANPDGSPLRPDSVSATVSALFTRLKIPRPKGGALHLLRHTMASQMLDGGVPLPVVSQRLGHSSVRVTADFYSHAIHGQDDEAVRRWEEYQRRKRPAKPENWKGDVQ